MAGKIAVAIIGGTGYGAGELLRLLTLHPEAKVVSVVSSSQAGRPVAESHPFLRKVVDLDFSSSLDFGSFAGYASSVIFAALPHGVTSETLNGMMPQIERTGCYLIDLSGDFRLKAKVIREKFYPETAAFPELHTKFTYGLSELTGAEIAKARYVSNPGCLATACVLAAAPLVSSTFQGDIVFDAKTGSSGAGRTPQENFHHPKRHGNFAAYKMLSHRHEPEILQGLGDPEGRRITSSFVPHLIPSARGIFASAYFQLPEAVSAADVRAKYEAFYEKSPFVRIVSDSPDLQSVIGSNFCDIAVSVRGKQVAAMSCLDNMVKGMAGSAIQNMNLMLGLPETTSLWFPGMGPV